MDTQKLRLRINNVVKATGCPPPDEIFFEQEVPAGYDADILIAFKSAVETTLVSAFNTAGFGGIVVPYKNGVAINIWKEMLEQ